MNTLSPEAVRVLRKAAILYEMRSLAETLKRRGVIKTKK
jgi:hypothetical protein